MKTALVLVVRVIALTIVLFVCFAIAGTLVGQADSQTAEQAGASAVTLLAVCLVEAAILTHLILRSSWTGWRLMATVFFRSEEHTSELQSQSNLVCRLLLEKKKKKNIQ